MIIKITYEDDTDEKEGNADNDEDVCEEQKQLKK